MKKSILILTTALFLFAGTAVLTSCGNNENEENTEHMNDADHHDMMNMDEAGHHDQTEAVTDTIYACPMHHNITGKKVILVQFAE